MMEKRLVNIAVSNSFSSDDDMSMRNGMMSMQGTVRHNCTV